MERPLEFDLALTNTSLCNTGKLGSFGEYLFSGWYAIRLGARVQSVHHDRFDFLVNGHSGRRETLTKCINDRLKSLRRQSQRIEWNGVSYALVEFSLDGARISIESDASGTISMSGTGRRVKSLADGPRFARQLGDASPFKPRAFRPYEANRRHSKFARLSRPNHLQNCAIALRYGMAHNLLPKKLEAGRITAYLDFADDSFTEKSIRRLSAFRCSSPPNAATRRRPGRICQKSIFNERLRGFVLFPLSRSSPLIFTGFF